MTTEMGDAMSRNIVLTVGDVDVGPASSVLESVQAASNVHDDPQLGGNPDVGECTLLESLDLGSFIPRVSSFQ